MSKTLIAVLAVAAGIYMYSKFEKRSEYAHDAPTIELEKPLIKDNSQIVDLTKITLVSGESQNAGAPQFNPQIPWESLYPESKGAPY